jgi:hypothetical protein
MAKRSARSHRNGSATRAIRQQKVRSKPEPSSHVPECLTEAIEAERGKLAQANSILACLAISLAYPPEDPRAGPYFPDVAEAVHDLIKEALNRLDSVSLQKAFQDRQVKDEALESNGETWPDFVYPDFLGCIDGDRTTYCDTRRVGADSTV